MTNSQPISLAEYLKTAPKNPAEVQVGDTVIVYISTSEMNRVANSLNWAHSMAAAFGAPRKVLKVITDANQPYTHRVVVEGYKFSYPIEWLEVIQNAN